MSVSLEHDDSSTRVDYVRLPNLIRTGRYDGQGHLNPNGRIFVSNANTAFIWSVFEFYLEPGQRGSMIFSNVPGTFLIGTSFTEWDPEQHAPTITDALLTLNSIERAEGKIRVVGRNASNRSIAAAVGIIIGDDAPYPQNSPNH